MQSITSVAEGSYKPYNTVAWRRTIAKSGVMVRVRVRSSHQTVSDYTLRRRFPNTQQSPFLTDRRRLEKLVLPSTFDKSFIVDDVKLAELYDNSFELKKYNILGGLNIIILITIIIIT